MNGLKLEDDVEQALTEEFQRPRSGAVRLAASEAMKRHWDDPKSVFNTEKYREAISEGNKKRSWTLTGLRHQPPPDVVVMQPCGYCGQPYHFRKVGQHEKGCQKNPNNVSHTS